MLGLGAPALRNAGEYRNPTKRNPGVGSHVADAFKQWLLIKKLSTMNIRSNPLIFSEDNGSKGT